MFLHKFILCKLTCPFPSSSSISRTLPKRKEVKNAYSVDVFDELLIRNEDRCDAEVQSITDVIPTTQKIPTITEKLRENPEGLQCLEQEVAQQQRDQLSEKDYSRGDCVPNANSENNATTSLETSSDGSSAETSALP